jgi:tetratricopeptide (TPR) repeat protein
MVHFTPDLMTSPLERDAWVQDNERGIALAADGDWAAASEAFAAAADALAHALALDGSDTREPLALVLSNLAQAYFHAGRVDDAMWQAERTCALRVAIDGDDGMPVARARMDLAVMLASTGRFDQATPLVQHAVSAIDHHDGGEDAHAATILENAARIALAAGHAADAEPLLRRLLALLDTSAPATTRAERLLARVEQVRAGRHLANAATATERRVGPGPDVAGLRDTDADMARIGEWDDLPLRDAVAVTDKLLRTTPSGVPLLSEMDDVVLPSPTPESPAPAHADRGAGERGRRGPEERRLFVLPEPEPEPSQSNRVLVLIIAGVVVLGGGAAAFLLLR